MTPDKYTIKESYLDVGDGHKLYIQEWGNAKAKNPIIFLHGGPGAGCHDGHKQLFDGERQRVIFFDQRGAGKSTPHGSLVENNTEKLIGDIERVADNFDLEDFIITGGSWGACLAFAYALKHPKRLKAMVLRGIFTGSKSETEYLDNGGFKDFFPDVWQAYLDRTPKEFHDDPTGFHQKQISSEDLEKIKLSSYAYSQMEGALLRLDDRYADDNFDKFDPDAMKIELSYLDKLCYMPDNYIFDNAHKITTPTWLVQGRYDMVCPPVTAYKMNQLMPNSKLIFTTAGHSASDRATYEVTRALLLELTAN